MPAKFNILVALTIPLVPIIPLLACGGDSKSPDASIHVIDSPGSGSGSGSGSGGACTAAATYTQAPSGSNQSAYNYPAGSNTLHAEEWDGQMNGDTMPDQLTLFLVAQRSGFGSGDIRPGTYALGSADTGGLRTCGICALMYTDLHMSGSGMTIETDDYWASAGSVTLSTTGSGGSGTLSGTITNLTLHQATIDFQAGTVTPTGNCTTSVSNIAFSAPLTAAFNGKGAIPIVLHRRYQ